jgi:hypothetical protein
MRLRDPDLPPGWPLLVASAVLIYAPAFVVECAAWGVDIVHRLLMAVDDNLADFGGDQ